MARQLKIDDREWIEVTDAAGNVTGGFWWNPSDLDIIKRCEKTLNFFETAQIPDVDTDLDKLYEFTDQVKTAFDELLNSSGASDVLFKNANPLTPRPDGTLHCQYVLDVLVDFISKEMNTRIKKSSSRVKKYTDKYKSA